MPPQPGNNRSIDYLSRQNNLVPVPLGPSAISQQVINDRTLLLTPASLFW